ncbi:MAG TPA: hypothetical protein ENI80_01290 [Acidiferrobacteraceae bacterium]|nr:hypothetical protein [Acidiferrobacteraceae bacterium]
MDKSRYFYRTVVFAKLKDKVMLVDLNDPEKEVPPLEPWLGLAISLADGQHTIQQLLDYMTDHYGGNPPDNLEKTIESVIERLTKNETIKLTEKAHALPYYLSRSADKLDIDMAKQAMADDGYHQG